MATLPENEISMSGGVIFEQQPSRTWRIDKRTGRIQGETEGLGAVKQAVDIILHVERFRHQIFQPSSGMEWDGLIGQDPGYVAAEMQRRLAEALTMDDRILGISDFSYTAKGPNLTAVFTADTVYGELQTKVEVELD